MCGTCGCSEHNQTNFTLPGEASDHHHKEEHTHEHDHNHSHDHHHENQNSIDVNKSILSNNQLLAERNKGYFEAKKITCINLVSSPGSGKTTLLEQTIKLLNNNINIYVVEGDQQTTNDAQRIHEAGAKSLQINTGNGCHLDAHMIHHAIEKLNPELNSLFIIENVGNLVCPALFDLGEKLRIVIISVTEGEDKPLKYPNMFSTSQICIINKCDLLPYVNFNIDKLKENASKINPDIKFIETTSFGNIDIQDWVSYLKQITDNV